MPLHWDDDDEEELTEIEYRRRPASATIHEEVTALDEPASARPTRKAPPAPKVVSQGGAQKHLGLLPAPARDRFAAFVIDMVVGLYLYWLCGYLLSQFLGAADFKVLHQTGARLALHYGSAVLIFFFYYLLMESVIGATLGKLFCRLRVLEVNGASPTLGNIFIRNFLRILDYPLLFLIAVISMESSPLKQRLGDRAASTMVIKKTRKQVPMVDLQHTPLASTLSRILAELLDLCFVLLLSYSLLLLMSAKHPFQGVLLYLSAPIAYFVYYILLEFLVGSTPGKVLFKRKVILENGQPPDGTSTLTRNLFRPLDYLLGYPLMIISPKKQRLGDMAANTLVVVDSCGRKGWWGSILALLLIGLVAWAGFSHSESSWKQAYGSNPIVVLKNLLPGVRLQKKSIKKPIQKPKKPVKKSALPETTSRQLKLVEFYLATGPEPTQIRHDRKFRQGDLIFLFFKVQGFQPDDENKVSISEDLKVEGPEGKIVLSKPKIVTINKEVQDLNSGILFANNLQLPKNAAKGSYRAIITVYDNIAGTQYSFERNFELQ